VEVDQNGGKQSNLAQMDKLKKLKEDLLMLLQPTLEVTQVTLVTLVTQVALTLEAVTMVNPETLKENSTVVKDVLHHLTAVVAICSVVLTLSFVWTELLKVLGELVAELAVLSLEVTVAHLHHMFNHNNPNPHVLIIPVIVHTGLPVENVLKTLAICLLIAKRVVTNAQVTIHHQEVTVVTVVTLVLTVVNVVLHHLTAVVAICSVVLTLNSVWIELPKVLGVPVAVHAALKEVTLTTIIRIINQVPVKQLAQVDSTVAKSAHHPLTVVVPACSVVHNGKYVWTRQLKVLMVTVVVLVTLLKTFKSHPLSNLLTLIWLPLF